MDEKTESALLCELERILDSGGVAISADFKGNQLTDEEKQAIELVQKIVRKHSEQTINQLKIMSSIVENSPYFIAYKTFEGKCLYVNPGASLLTGYSREELMENYVGLLFGDAGLGRATSFKEVLAEKGIIKNEHVATIKGGEERVFSGTSFVIEDGAYATLVLDVTEARKIESEHMQTLQTMNSILNSLDAMIYVTIPQTGEILFMNEQMREHYNFGDDVIGKRCYNVLQDDEDGKCNFCPCHQLDEAPNSVVVWEKANPLTMRLYKNTDRYIDWHNGEKVHIQYSVDITDIERTTRSLTEALTDISKAQDSLEKALVETNTDPLTGIYNRRFFNDKLPNLVMSLSRSSSPLSVLMVDIDFFKKFNDTYGHGEGDYCLKKVSQALKDSLPRDEDFVARYGGEEFVVVLPNTSEDGAKVVAERLLNTIRELKIPHENSEMADHVTVSIGVTTGQASHTHAAEAYINWADKMLYKSKNEGRNRYTYAHFEEET
ncbi:MAG: diguanylate cyclase [Oscillospiraceae bacterium]|nr:diguanylate cyclase [Oscillospiraceae bacterium]